MAACIVLITLTGLVVVCVLVLVLVQSVFVTKVMSGNSQGRRRGGRPSPFAKRVNGSGPFVVSVLGKHLTLVRHFQLVHLS